MTSCEVPEDWQNVCIVQMNKGKGYKSECPNYKGISLLTVTGILYERGLSGW